MHVRRTFCELTLEQVSVPVSEADGGEDGGADEVSGDEVREDDDTAPPASTPPRERSRKKTGRDAPLASGVEDEFFNLDEMERCSTD